MKVWARLAYHTGWNDASTYLSCRGGTGVHTLLPGGIATVDALAIYSECLRNEERRVSYEQREREYNQLRRTMVGGRSLLLCAVPIIQPPFLQPCMSPPCTVVGLEGLEQM